MAIYQVNQSESFNLEFKGRYLCCPVGTYGGWQIMTRLKVGDIIIHYDGSLAHKMIRGISEVIPTASVKERVKNPHIVSKVCSIILPPHLSLNSFSSAKKTKVMQYNNFYVVYVNPIVAMDDAILNNLPHVVYGGYLCNYPFPLNIHGVKIAC